MADEYKRTLYDMISEMYRDNYEAVGSSAAPKLSPYWGLSVFNPSGGPMMGAGWSEKDFEGQGMSEEEAKKNKKSFMEKAKKRIKTGLILNEFGEQNKINVTEQELQSEIQKQISMMPGQEKLVQEYYQKNPSLLSNLRGSLYEEKIIKAIKEKAKINKKIITKEEAEKLLKDENEKNLIDHEHHRHDHDHNHDHSNNEDETKNEKKITSSSKKARASKKVKTSAKKSEKVKKVSKK